ncbi:MAG: hypothetical protein C1943_07295 [Halochromatium sp.]|nr:hypothetical protein [Halochromatium sp.]
MSFTARIPECHRTWLARYLAPLFWPKRYLDGLEEAIVGMIWSELIENETTDIFWINLLAFLVFSGFCLFAYHSQAIPYLIVVLALLPLLDKFLNDHLGLRTRQSVISVQSQQTELEWRRLTPGSVSRSIRLSSEEMRGLFICAWTCGAGAQGWMLMLMTDTSAAYPLAFKDNFGAAWRTGLQWSDELNQPLKVQDSVGHTAAAEFEWEDEVEVRDWMWQAVGNSRGWRLERCFRTLRWRALGAELMRQSGYFLFLAIMAGVMERYGAFLSWMMGPKLGLTEPTTLPLDFSVSGIIGFFTPSVDLAASIAIGIALIAIASAMFRVARSRAISVDAAEVRLQGAQNGLVRRLSTQDIEQVLLLYEPRPLLLLIGQDASLVIDDLSSKIELEEVYTKLSKLLARFKPGGE